MLKRKLFSPKPGLRGGVLLLLFATNATFAQEFKMKALAAEFAKPSVYEIALTTASALEPDAEFVLDFPAEFDLSQLQIAGSPDMTGGFTLTRDKQKVMVKRSGFGQRVASGTAVRLRLGAIINPKNFESSSEVTLQVRASTRGTTTSFAKQRVLFEPAKQHEFKN